MTTAIDPQLVFAASNNHTPHCGDPPGIRTEDHARYYYGYFENQYGEQWVFVYDGETGIGSLRGGDTSWGHEWRVENGAADGVRLNDAELVWLGACWSAAVARFRRTQA